MLWKGFRFGMILQLAVGPICLLVLNTATEAGFFRTLPLIAAVALVDALFIALAGFGVAALLKKATVQRWLRGLGGLILLLFGLNLLLSAFQVPFIPAIALFSGSNSSFFWQGIIFTASNPLTILFWGGVFSAKISEETLSGKQIVGFGAGCVLATVCFMLLVAFCGCLLGSFLPPLAIRVLNGLVGVFLIGFGVKLWRQKQ